MWSELSFIFLIPALFLGFGLAFYIATHKTLEFEKLKNINNWFLFVFVMMCSLDWIAIFLGNYSILTWLIIYLIALKSYFSLLEAKITNQEKLQRNQLIKNLIMFASLVCIVILVAINIKNGMLELSLSTSIIYFLIILGLAIPQLFTEPKFCVFTYMLVLISCSIFLVTNNINVFLTFAFITLILFEINCVQVKKVGYSKMYRNIERVLGIFILLCFFIAFIKGHIYSKEICYIALLLFLLLLFLPYPKTRILRYIKPPWAVRHIIQNKKMPSHNESDDN